jgi:Na+-transporting NADH:ubiquinone oxidoreductase subunit F
MEDLTYDIKLMRLRLADAEEIHFTPGQYVQLQSKPYAGVKSSVSRAYSIASPSSETKSVDLMIRLVPDGICTTWVHGHLEKGESVTFTGPMGDFRLHEGEGEIVMVAGGSGMAPMVSLLDELVRSKSNRKITYFFGAVTKRDLFYMNEMDIFMKENPNFKFVLALSQPAPEDTWKGETGLITVPLENYLKTIEPSRAQGYMCGSPGMIKACMGVFNRNGVSNDRIFFDPFA